MFRIKVCGITTVDDARMVAEAGADAIGLNFYAPSPRYVDLTTARLIVHALPQHVSTVGLFVNAPVESILRIADDLALGYVQLHGDEPPESLVRLAPCKIIRAFRVAGDYRPLLAYLRTCDQLGCPPAAVLADALDPGKYGGTGQVGNWDAIAAFQADAATARVVLAGGLTPGNVADAIRQVRPAAVDVASGVESQPGRKARALVAQFVQAAVGAWERASGG